jgi:hypothetical protein
MRISPLNRILLLSTCVLAAYQVVVGINGLEDIPMVAYTIAFGILLVAALLLIILGYDALNAPLVVVVSTIIALSLSLGLVWEHMAAMRVSYLAFTILGLMAIAFTRSVPIPGKLPTIVLALVHGAAGLIVFALPSILAAQSHTRAGFGLVGLGGALIGLAGLLLSFLKTGRPIVSREVILKILPAVLLLMTVFFVTGFALA